MIRMVMVAMVMVVVVGCADSISPVVMMNAKKNE